MKRWMSPEATSSAGSDRVSMTRTLAAPVTLLLLVFPAAAPTNADDFGVNIAFYRDAYQQAELMAAAGVRWVRVDLAWSSAEPEPGRYDFRRWDRFVDTFEPHGIRVLFILDYGNDMYDEGFPPSTESGRAAFAAFAGAAARHFRGRGAWEIWNEPNLPQYWAGSPDPVAYVALARAAAAEIRRADPRAWILGPSLGGGTFDYAYLDATFALGLLDVVDAVSVHPYGAAYPEAAATFYEEIRRRIAAHAPGRDIPVVVSEWGYALEGLGAEGQADYLMRALAVNRRAGIPITIWFNWQEPVNAWHSFGLLDVRGRPKPAYRAVLRERGAAATVRRDGVDGAADHQIRTRSPGGR
jgi:polysaccharide biosynthesis protein PslG